MLYLTLKTLHVIGVVLFLGNVITAIFWKAHGDRGDLPARVLALEGIIRADRLFTSPGVLIILVTGVALALVGHHPLLTPWIAGSIALFALAGAVFGAWVGPLQKKLLANVRSGLSGTWNESEYGDLSNRWRFWGWVATIAPLLALVLMVLKPTW